jgi:hypothetical protein
MYGQVHANLVLYKRNPKPGHRYRQIIVVELEQFQVRVLGGDVVQADPQFSAESQDAEVYFHSSLQSAVDDAEKEFKGSVEAGWIPYDLHNPQL